MPVPGRMLEVRQLSAGFEYFNDHKDRRLSDLETKAAELETKLFDWRETLEREIAESTGQCEAPPSRAHETYRAGARATASGHAGSRRTAPLDDTKVPRSDGRPRTPRTDQHTKTPRTDEHAETSRSDERARRS